MLQICTLTSQRRAVSSVGDRRESSSKAKPETKCRRVAVQVVPFSPCDLASHQALDGHGCSTRTPWFLVCGHVDRVREVAGSQPMHAVQFKLSFENVKMTPRLLDVTTTD
jgi:hypothetical protein